MTRADDINRLQMPRPKPVSETQTETDGRTGHQKRISAAMKLWWKKRKELESALLNQRE